MRMDFVEEIEAVIPSLRRYAHALVHDRAAAEDLVEDCLKRALARRAEWQPGAAVKTCMFRILLNRYRDSLRLAPPRLAVVESLPGPRRVDRMARPAIREVQEAIARLPADQRVALLLVMLEDMSFDEAAQLLSISRHALISRLARARAALAQMTTPQEPQRSIA